MCIICDAKGDFAWLESQKLVECTNCKELKHIPPIPSRTLIGVNCPALVSVEAGASTQEMMIRNCPALTSVAVAEPIDALVLTDNPNLSSIILPMASKLRVFSVFSSAKLSALPCSKNMPGLKSLIVYDMPSLTYLPYYAGVVFEGGRIACPLMDVSPRYAPAANAPRGRAAGRRARAWAQRARNAALAKKIMAAELEFALLPPLLAIAASYVSGRVPDANILKLNSPLAQNKYGAAYVTF